MPQLLLATNNRHKIGEFRTLLRDCGWDVVTPNELGLHLDVDESGATYAENAALKALAFARASGLTSLADDSGLEVDALDGAPGIHAARFAGPDATDADRRRLLLQRLNGVPKERRTARFHAVIAIATPEGKVVFNEGLLEGLITDSKRGTYGFGYDPIFALPNRGPTLAQISADEKNRISHRGLAAQEACHWLLQRVNAMAKA